MAAKAAEREAAQATDAADFEDKLTTLTSLPKDPALRRRKIYASDSLDPNNDVLVDDFDYQDRGHSVGMYMLRYLEWSLKDIPLAPPNEKLKSKSSKAKENNGEGAGLLAGM